MVTPYSQFVGVQATMNVIAGERYKEVADEVIQYALGFWGEEECTSMDAAVKDKILNRPRARELKHWEPPDPSLQEFRQQFGEPGISDDELLLRYFSNPADVAAMKAAGPGTEYVSGKQPILSLIESLSKQSGRQIHVRTRGISIHLEQKRAK
jgi:oxaloacetate decarboxylase alpha subunit